MPNHNHRQFRMI